MTVDAWLAAALADADARGLPELKPLLTSLAAATKALRDADWNEEAAGEPGPTPAQADPGGSGCAGEGR
jgi:hypothetical protein